MTMELKFFTIVTIFILCLLATPYFSRVGGSSDMVDTEVYEIDYRGPETHSAVPPPNHSHRKPLPLIHKESSMGSPKSKSFRGGKMGRKAKKLHA